MAADPDPDSDTDKSTEWAEERTDWAEDRTLMAVERTFAGWLRTSFAAIGIGLGFKVVFGEFDPPWLAKAIATLFILLGMVFALSAERRATKAFADLENHKVRPLETPNLRWIAWSIAGGALVLIAGLWILNDGRIGS